METRETLVLASGSEIRRRLLRDAGFRFVVEPARLDEEAFVESDPDARALGLARLKAQEVSARRPGRLVLGSDQVFTFEGRPRSKPRNRDELIRKLIEINGRSHRFHCGMVLVRDGAPLVEVVDHAEVSFHELSRRELEDYADLGEGIGCAGGYRLEEGGVRLIREIVGSHFTVLGLPVLELVAALRSSGLADRLFRRPGEQETES